MYTINYSSGVYGREDDRTARVQGVLTSSIASVFAAKRGPANQIRPVTDIAEREAVYGISDPTISLATYGVDESLKATNRAYCVRVTVDAKFGGVMVSKRSANQKLPPGTTGATPSAGVGQGTLTNGSYSYKIVAVDEAGKSLPSIAATATVVTSPTTASLTTALGNPNDDLVYRAKTAGVAGNSNTITYTAAVGNNLPLIVTVTPVGGTHCTVAITLATNGSGTIITTASDVLLALRNNANFNTYLTVDFAPSNTGVGILQAMASTPLAGGAASGMNDGRVTVTWTAVVGAIGYEVYGRVGGSELKMAAVDANVLTFIDNGSITPAGAIPGANTTSDLAITPFSGGYEDPLNEIAFSTGDLFAVFGENPGAWNNNELRVSIDKVNDVTGQFDIAIYRPGQTIAYERWTVSRSRQLDGYGRQLQMEERINPLSQQITVLNNAADTQIIDIPYLTPTSMGGGDDGTTPTMADIANAWELFSDPEEVPIRILLNGGYADPGVQLKMNDICVRRKDCIAILDVPSDQQDYQSAINYRNNTLNLDSTYAALYVCDQQIVDDKNDLTLYVPVSGFVGRALADTDRRFAPWIAAAGMDRGNVNSLGSRYRYNHGQRDILAENQVNYVRSFVGYGFKLWEQFTCTKTPKATQFLNVRLLNIFIQASILDYLLFSVHDPNDPITRRRIKGRIDQFLDGVVAGRGLSRYKTVCDDTNNKAADQDEGLLNVDVYLNPIIPARRILLTTIITPTGATFKEEVLAAGGGF